jgi:hypothetical protein
VNNGLIRNVVLNIDLGQLVKPILPGLLRSSGYRNSVGTSWNAQLTHQVLHTLIRAAAQTNRLNARREKKEIVGCFAEGVHPLEFEGQRR